MLYQLHWQFEVGTPEMKAQKEINSTAEMKSWQVEVAERHPLPEGAIWLICNEESKHFVWATQPPENKNGSTDAESSGVEAALFEKGK